MHGDCAQCTPLRAHLVHRRAVDLKECQGSSVAQVVTAALSDEEVLVAGSQPLPGQQVKVELLLCRGEADTRTEESKAWQAVMVRLAHWCKITTAAPKPI